MTHLRDRGQAAVEELASEMRRSFSPGMDARDRRAARHEQLLAEYSSDLAERTRLGEIGDHEANELLSDQQERYAAEDRAASEAPMQWWGRDLASMPRSAPAEIEDASEDERRAEMLVIAADSDGTLYPTKKQIIAMLRERARTIFEERSPLEGGTRGGAYGARKHNPLYPAIGPASDRHEKGERKDNPVSTVPLKLLQPVVGGQSRLSNPLESRNMTRRSLRWRT